MTTLFYILYPRIYFSEHFFALRQHRHKERESVFQFIRIKIHILIRMTRIAERSHIFFSQGSQKIALACCKKDRGQDIHDFRKFGVCVFHEYWVLAFFAVKVFFIGKTRADVVQFLKGISVIKVAVILVVNKIPKLCKLKPKCPLHSMISE